MKPPHFDFDVDFDLVNQYVKDGFISCRKHPTADLRIYNYTPKTQYERFWNKETANCRGLIVDGNDRIVARGFQKFFNYEELNGEVPIEPFEVYEKVDGCLAILHFIDDRPFIATRGSFESEQAVAATEVFRLRGYDEFQFDRNLTYLFELVHPKFRIVCDYGDLEDLFLLATVETETGKEMPMPIVSPFPRARRYDCTELGSILAMQNDTDEGFVVRFDSGLRCKIKMAEYKRLHKILTNATSRRIYEYMAIADMRNQYDAKQMGRTLFMDPTEVAKIAARPEPFAEILERVPDEFMQWVKKTEIELKERFAEVEEDATRAFVDLGDRALNAERYRKSGYPPPVLFDMLDQKPHRHHFWRLIRPKHQKPFREDDG